MEQGDEQAVECTLCPRMCRARRVAGEMGACGVTSHIKVARSALHMWEEPCISGTNGSGTVFFSGCPLHCVYCQNGKISGGSAGKVITTQRLCELFLKLQEKLAHNINLVTPTHYADGIVEALAMAKKRGLTIPIVYNTSGYERVKTLQMLAPYVDIYLTDFKYYDNALGETYSGVKNYFNIADGALQEMVRQKGGAVFNQDGMMEKGVIVRHLMLPTHEQDSKNILLYLHSTFAQQIYVSIMNQYTPMEKRKDYPELSYKISKRAYDRLVDYSDAIGIRNGFVQEGETAKESFIPPFDCEGV